jgi:hypothetical protein
MWKKRKQQAKKLIKMPYVIKLKIISNLFVKMCLLKVSKLPTNWICRSGTPGGGTVFEDGLT